MLITDEGLKLKVYHCTAGKPTVGVGRNLEGKGLSDAEQEMIFGRCGLSRQECIQALQEQPLTKEQALTLLEHDILACWEELEEHFDWFSALALVPQMAVLNLSFNVGLHVLKGFKHALTALENGDLIAAAEHFADSRWFQQVKFRGQRVVNMLREGTLPTIYEVRTDVVNLSL